MSFVLINETTYGINHIELWGKHYDLKVLNKIESKLNIWTVNLEIEEK